jgi:hypothetical protein|tara:strand:+ start:303 stop:572 length:270 start_codon:yes stop_codon:yes gene_type:complete
MNIKNKRLVNTTAIEYINECAIKRSLSQPGELIYAWVDTSGPNSCDIKNRRPDPQDNTLIVFSNEEELQYNNVRDYEIVSVWRDGEEME